MRGSGIRALLLQMFHPLAMAGVADHSDSREDPSGRLSRTAHFVTVTTYGSTEAAERAMRAHVINGLEFLSQLDRSIHFGED